MERFLQFIVGGGLSLVGGLWVLSLAVPWTGAWGLGIAVTAIGLVALSTGIWTELAPFRSE